MGDLAALLAASNLSAHSEEESLELLRATEFLHRQLQAFGVRQLADAEARSLHKRHGVGSMRQFLIETLRLSKADAGCRVAALDQVGVRHDVSGAPIPPRLPRTAEIAATGDISADHVRAIATVMARIPAAASFEDKTTAETLLAETAREVTPDDLTRVVGHRILSYLEDGTVTDDIDRARIRELILSPQRADGMSALKGMITPGLRALLEPVLAKYARPGMCNPDDPESPTAGATSTDPDAVAAAAARDSRTAGQRNHDALEALLAPNTRPHQLGEHRGLPVAAIFTMTIDQLEAAAGVATTATGGTVSVPQALKLAERAKPYLVVFDHAGMPLHCGRARRLAMPVQRMALIAAERGCTRPGCDAPASLAAVHHITEWSRQGRTDIDNLTLVCDRCHSMVHNGPGGWKTVRMGSDSEYAGRTGWIAPAHIDPTRTPRVNHRHHADELLGRTRRPMRGRHPARLGSGSRGT